MVYLAELEVRITVRFKIVRIYARSGPYVHGHKRLDDDATENEKPHLQLHVFYGVLACAASGNMSVYRVEGVKMRYCLLFLEGRIFNSTNLLNHVSPFIELTMQM